MNSATQKELIDRRLKLALKCGSCIYLYRRHKKFDKPCSELKKTESSVCCNYYTPNYSNFIENEPQAILDLCAEMRNHPAHTKQVLAYSLLNELELQRVTERVRGIPMHVGYPVAVRLLANKSQDCVAMWARGYLMGISRCGGFIHVGAKCKAHNLFPGISLRSIQDHAPKGLHSSTKHAFWWVHYVIPVDSDSYMTRAEFNKHKKRLVKQGRINPKDLSILRRFLWKPITKKEAKASDYLPPSLADVPAEWLSKVKLPHLSKGDDVGEGDDGMQHYTKTSEGAFQIG